MSTVGQRAAIELPFISVFGKIPSDPSVHRQPAFCLCILLESVHAHAMLLLPVFSTPIYTALYRASL